MTLLSPYFWLAMAIWSAVCASSGAVLMERIKNAELVTERAQVQQVADAQVANASLVAQAAQSSTTRLAAQLAASERARTAATSTAKGNVHALVSPQADARVVVPAGFIRLWNDPLPGGPGGQAGGATAPGSAADANDRPSGVALSAVAADGVVPAKDALQACREEVRGWQDHWAIVVTWYNNFVKGLAP